MCHAMLHGGLQGTSLQRAGSQRKDNTASCSCTLEAWLHKEVYGKGLTFDECIDKVWSARAYHFKTQNTLQCKIACNIIKTKILTKRS